jgi:hydrogenase maturation protease
VIDLLVIGYGNDLRSDDGAGRVVAAAIEERGLPGVVVRSVSQLTPELALDVVAATRVVFADADVEVGQVTVTPVVAGSGGTGIMTHRGDPAGLLSLAANLGETLPAATLISIPADNVGLGFELSEATAAAVAEAVELVVGMVEHQTP